MIDAGSGSFKDVSGPLGEAKTLTPPLLYAQGRLYHRRLPVDITTSVSSSVTESAAPGNGLLISQ